MHLRPRTLARVLRATATAFPAVIVTGTRQSGKTVRAWMSVLEAGSQIPTLKLLFENLGKRLVKRPKVYVLDTGTLAYLVGATQREQLLTGQAVCNAQKLTHAASSAPPGSQSLAIA